jgi:hypothetical protein
LNEAGRHRSVRMTPPIWLEAASRPRPTRACWTCGREVAVMRMRAEDLRPHGWQPGRTLHIPAWCGCTTEFVPVPVGDGGWQPRKAPDLAGRPLPQRRWPEVALIVPMRRWASSTRGRSGWRGHWSTAGRCRGAPRLGRRPDADRVCNTREPMLPLRALSRSRYPRDRFEGSWWTTAARRRRAPLSNRIGAQMDDG